MTQPALIKQFVETVSNWEQIDPEPHRFGGTEFRVGKVEIGHIHHNNGMVDIPFTVKIRTALLEEGLADYHHFLPESGWISYYIRDSASLEQAIWLMRLSYLHKTSRRTGINQDTLASLEMSDAIRLVAFPQLS